MTYDFENHGPEVSANHRRIISVRLRSLEGSCLQLQEVFRPVDSILSSRSAIPKEKTQEVERLMPKLLSVIQGMKWELELESDCRNAERVAGALVSSMEVNVEELLPQYLKGYGEVSEDLATYLETRVDELLGILREIERVLAKRAG